MQNGEYTGEIVRHGLGKTQSGLSFVWVDLVLCEQVSSELILHPVTTRILMEGKTEQSSLTMARMARAALKLCGFDPDTHELWELSEKPEMLRGVKVPVAVSEREWQGRFQKEYRIQAPSALDRMSAGKASNRLRAAKSKAEDEQNDQVPF